MSVEFPFKDETYVAVNAGWEKNRFEVYEIHDSNDNFVAAIMVSPLESVQSAVAKWAEENSK